jgi:hypothetical protein
MPLGLIRVDPDLYPPIAMQCLRCGTETPLRFAGPCAACAGELRANFCGEARVLDDTEYVPKVNVTANAVALKET